MFYRGLGRIELPLRVGAMAPEMALVRNYGDEPIAEAFVFDMRKNAGRFVTLDSMGAHAGAPAMLNGPLRPRVAVIEDLEAAVSRALVGHGLFEDEARDGPHLVAHAAEGTRVMYVVPNQRTEAILPLTIQPRPEKLVRVLVGRHEVLTMEREQELVSLLKERLAPATRDEATRELAKLGRFLEPAVRRAIALGDALVAKSGEELLAAFSARP